MGIDLIPAQPPKGVSTFQGDFLSPLVQKLVKDFILQSTARKPPKVDTSQTHEGQPRLDEEGLAQPSYIDISHQPNAPEAEDQPSRVVDVSN